MIPTPPTENPMNTKKQAAIKQQLADIKRDLADTALRVQVAALYKSGSQPQAIAQHLNLKVDAVKAILNLPTY